MPDKEIDLRKQENDSKGGFALGSEKSGKTNGHSLFTSVAAFCADLRHDSMPLLRLSA